MRARKRKGMLDRQIDRHVIMWWSCSYEAVSILTPLRRSPAPLLTPLTQRTAVLRGACWILSLSNVRQKPEATHQRNSSSRTASSTAVVKQQQHNSEVEMILPSRGRQGEDRHNRATYDSP